MSDNVKISYEIGTTDSTIPLGLEVWVDDQKFFETDCVQPQQLSIDVPDDEGEHELRFVLKHKRSEHTKIDAAGNIVSDATVIIKNLIFDEVPLGHVFTKLAEYHHDFNGTQNTTCAKFYGEMGCNGTLSLKFTSPIYVWLLENI